MARSEGETGSSLLRAWMVVKQLLMASYVRSTALLYVLQGDLRNFLAVRASYRDAGSPGEFLNPHGKLLSASRASDLHASGFGFFIHTGQIYLIKINKPQALLKFIDFFPHLCGDDTAKRHRRPTISRPRVPRIRDGGLYERVHRGTSEGEP